MALIKDIPLHKQAELLVVNDSGDPLDFSKMPFFIPIYDKPRNKLLLFTSRQSGKTTKLLSRLFIKSVSVQGNTALYVAPVQSQVRDFSVKKFNKIFEYQKALKDQFTSTTRRWNVGLKEFTTGSTITLKSIGGPQGASRVRGITANDLCIDELQSINEEELPVIEETAATFDGRDGRKQAEYIYSGTPLSTQNLLSKQFERSKKWEWHVRCPHCNKWNDKVGMQHINPDLPYFFCQFCKEDLNSPPGYYGEERVPPQGIWLSHNAEGKFDGYRIVRLVMPWARWRTDADDGILDRFESFSERRFKNEVMAIAHDGNAVPVTEKMVRACCDESLELNTTEGELIRTVNKHAQYHKFCGIDWAMQSDNSSTSSYTIFSAFAYVNGKMKLIFAHRFVGHRSNDPDYVLSQIKKWITIIGPTGVGVDYGVGYKEDMRLIKAFGRKKILCFEYKGGSVNSESKFDAITHKWIVSKTRALDQLCADIKEERFIFPAYDKVKHYTDDMLNLTTDVNYRLRSIQYNRQGTDDFAHSANYANLARLFHLKSWDFSGHPGVAEMEAQSNNDYGQDLPVGISL